MIARSEITSESEAGTRAKRKRQKRENQATDASALAWSYSDVAKATSLSRRTIVKLVSSGDFPQPRVVNGKRLLFVVEEVRAWLQALPRHAS